MANIISCRISVYGDFETACDYLVKAGITHAEVPAPEDGDWEGIRKTSEEKGVAVATISTGVQLSDEKSIAAFHEAMTGTASIGTCKMFVSIGGNDDADDETLYGRIRDICRRAEELDLTLCLETHEPFGQNAVTALRTLEAVDSPALRLNYDTANIYYYNKDVDGIEELKAVADKVAAVHLKETDGGYHSFNFSVLGQGIVNFPEVFSILNDIGMNGPFTFELEGPVVDGKDIDERHQIVLDCVEHLKSIGV